MVITLSKKKKIKTLDSEIQIVQIEKYENDFNCAMKKDILSGLKRVALVVVPLNLSLIVFLIFKNPVIILTGLGITSITGTITLSEAFIKDLKILKLNNHKSKSNVINAEHEKDIQEILQENIIKVKAEDFYSNKYKQVIQKEKKCVETEDEIKYREAQEKHQKQSAKNCNDSLDNGNYLSKDETMIQIAREMDVYAFVYDLAPIEISNIHWDMFLQKHFYIKKIK